MSSLMTNERLLRFIEDGDIKQALEQPLQAPSTRAHAIRNVLRGAATEDNAISTITLGKFLYDYLRLNPLVVKGIDFARKEQFNNMFEFSYFARRAVRAGILRSAPTMNGLKGYVAEQIAAWLLQAKGHDVVFPEHPNNPGWDLLVDGMKFQVKCVTDPNEVWKHIRLYPDIPVLVNEEMAGRFAGVGNVHVLPALKESAVARSTEDTLRRGHGMTRFEIPWVSLMVMSGTALVRVVSQKTDLAAAFTTVAVDTASRTFMGYVGRQAIACAGSMLIGPAGWVIGQQMGQVAGARLGKPIADKVKQAFVQNEVAQVYEGVSGVLTCSAEEVNPKMDVKGEQEETLTASMLTTKANDHVMGCVKEQFQEAERYLKNKRQEMLSCARDPQGVFHTPIGSIQETCILTTRAGIHPQALQTQWNKVAGALENLQKGQKRFGL